MSCTVVVGGRGYVGSTVVSELRKHGRRTVSASRTPAGDGSLASSDLAGALGRDVSQVVLTVQLGLPDARRYVEMVDGPRWLVFSSMQLAAATPSPMQRLAREHEDIAIARGATVLRPTMIFGGGRDLNITRMIRLLRRYRLMVVVDGGTAMVQPIHVLDIVELVRAHASRPTSGAYAAAGDEALPIRELNDMLRAVSGKRALTIDLRRAWLAPSARFARTIGLRPDQLLRMAEDKVADIQTTVSTFGWLPAPFAVRLEQAVYESM